METAMNEYFNIFLFVCFLIFNFSFNFVFYYKSFASTDIAMNQMRIQVHLKIFNTRSN